MSAAFSAFGLKSEIRPYGVGSRVRESLSKMTYVILDTALMKLINVHVSGAFQQFR